MACSASKQCRLSLFFLNNVILVKNQQNLIKNILKKHLEVDTIESHLNLAQSTELRVDLLGYPDPFYFKSKLSPGQTKFQAGGLAD